MAKEFKMTDSISNVEEKNVDTPMVEKKEEKKKMIKKEPPCTSNGQKKSPEAY